MPGFEVIDYDDVHALEIALSNPNVCGLWLEPIQGEAGVFVPQDGYLKAAENLCRKNNVLLMMDSVTRLAMAQREIGLAAGEPPSQKGYTPSVFSLLPKICERAGNFDRGSITAFFTVLVEGDDFNEPICDAVRAILDGHIILSRQLGAMGHYPAIDILNSVSRLAGKIAPANQQDAARKIREALAGYQQSEDLINLGAYAAGSNPRLDAAIRFLRRPGGETPRAGDELLHALDRRTRHEREHGGSADGDLGLFGGREVQRQPQAGQHEAEDGQQREAGPRQGGHRDAGHDFTSPR